MSVKSLTAIFPSPYGIHIPDYLLDAGTLKILKKQDEFVFTTPGSLKLSVEEIFKGGNSKSRNPNIQLMPRMIGFGDNAGSGIPTILNAWKQADWVEPDLHEDTHLDQVTLTSNQRINQRIQIKNQQILTKNQRIV